MKEHVNHPPHYGGEENPYETIKVIEAWGLGFCPGNAVKYISRAGKKNPQKEIEDLEKAIWYLNREIEKLKKIQKNEPSDAQKMVKSIDEAFENNDLLKFVFGEKQVREEDFKPLDISTPAENLVIPTLSEVVDYLSGGITTGGDKIITVRKTNQDGEEQITEENPLMGETKETPLEDFIEVEEPPKSKPLVVDIDDVIDAVLEKDKTAFDALNVGEIVEIKSANGFGNNIEGTLRYVISSGREHIVPFKTENNAIEYRDYIVVEDNEENSSNIDLIAIEVKGVTYLLQKFEWQDWDISEEKISNELKIGDLFRVLTLSSGEGTLRLKTRTQEKLAFTSTDSLNLDITYIVLKDNPGNILSKDVLTIKVNDKHYVIAEAFQFGENPKES
jgi:hypothetical protein